MSVLLKYECAQHYAVERLQIAHEGGREGRQVLQAPVGQEKGEVSAPEGQHEHPYEIPGP